MSGTKWWVWVLASVLVISSATGCKRTVRGPGAAGRPGPGDAVTPWDPDQIGLEGWDSPERPFDLEGRIIQELQGQFDSVYFGFDRYAVDASERPKVERVAIFLRDHADVGVIVDGHTDERGSAEYNLALGERRALAVRQYLTTLGIDGSRIQTRSFGEERPAAPGTGESVWSLNRRAEFSFYR